MSGSKGALAKTLKTKARSQDGTLNREAGQEILIFCKTAEIHSLSIMEMEM